MANDTLRDLYYGRINPFGTRLVRDEEMDRLIKQSQDLEHEVFACLDEAGKQKFTDFLNTDGDLGDNQQFQAFCNGFRIGTKLMVETFVENLEKQNGTLSNIAGGVAAD